MDSKAVANPLGVPKSPKPNLENIFPRIPHFPRFPLGPGLAPVAAPCEPCPVESPQYKRALPCSRRWHGGGVSSAWRSTLVDVLPVTIFLLAEFLLAGTPR